LSQDEFPVQVLAACRYEDAGLRMIHEPRYLRFFQARFERL